MTDQRVLDGRYQVERLLGSGGMARVWQARDLRLGRPVAVKELSVEEPRDSTALERFEREARAIARLSHPNIVSVYDFGNQDGQSYLVMELVEGPTLAQLLADGPLPIPDVLAAAAQTCDGLAAAHAAGIVHRDIKPGNLILTPTGVVKICDFGVARLLDAAALANLTGSSDVMGSPNYMAPEQIKGGPIGPEADLYALGCVMYALFAGSPPFMGESPVAIAHQHLTTSPEPLRTRRPELAAEVETLVTELLAKKPADRPSDAASVRQRILSAAGDPPLVAASVLRSAAPTALVSPNAWAPAAVHAAVGAGDEPATLPTMTAGSASVPAAPLAPEGPSQRATGAVVAAVLAVLAMIIVLFLMLRPGPDQRSAGTASGVPTVAPSVVISPSVVVSASPFVTPSAVASAAVPATLPVERTASPVASPSDTQTPGPTDPIAALRRSIRQAVAAGSLAADAAEDLQHKVDDLAKSIAVDDAEEQAKKLKSLRDRLLSLYEEGKLTADGYRVLDRRVDQVAAELS
jgi:eukaryotic-like serine/threonine-protein kinase